MISITLRSALHIAEILGGRELVIELTCATDIYGLLKYLAMHHGQEFKEQIFDGDGAVKEEITVLLNGCNILALDAYNQFLKDGDDVLILPVVGGG
jgi:molybdopterin converting factor small subunit